MIRYYFTIPFLLAFYLSNAQEVVVALPSMNVIYMGLENPIKIAVEGYTYNQLTISTNNCELKGEYPNTYLTVDKANPATCLVLVSYKKVSKIIIDTINFRIKSVPKPKAMFGTVDEGWVIAPQLMVQTQIRAVIPNFVFQGLYYKVTSYSWKFIKNSKFMECSGIENESVIAKKLQKAIMTASRGDKIIIDKIVCKRNDNGEEQILDPIEIFVESKTNITNNLGLIIYDNNSTISYLPIQPLLDCDHKPILKPGKIKWVKIEANDTILVHEFVVNNEKIQIHKQYYSSGKLKLENNYNYSDSIGKSTSYYENGEIKSEGYFIISKDNISETYGDKFYFAGISLVEAEPVIYKFIELNCAPIGQWKGYHPNGKVALECFFKLEGWKSFEYELSHRECGTHEVQFYSIADAIRHPENQFYSTLSGPCKTFDDKGRILTEEEFKE